MILNLTQHQTTRDQQAEGVVDITDPLKRGLARRLLTFESIPTAQQIIIRAQLLAQVADELSFSEVMIGGAPYLMPELERALFSRGIKPCYAFSIRDTQETLSEDGTLRKVNIFRHRGLIRKIDPGAFWVGDILYE